MRRNQMDICHDILEVAESGAKKTQLVYKANLNFRMVDRYLELLIDAGHIEYREDLRRYFTTDRGSYWMESYAAIVSPLKLIMDEAEAEAPQM